MKNGYLKSLLLLCLVSFISQTILSAQSIYYNTRQASSIDVVLGGDMGFRLISSPFSDTRVAQELLNRGQFEQQKLNYRFGINYYQGLTNNLSLKTGFRVSNPGFSTSAIEEIDVEQDINHIVKFALARGSEYRYHYQLIEIPIGIRYVISKTFCEPYTEIGVSTNFYRKTIVEQKLYEGDSHSKSIIEDINNVNFIGFLAVGGDYTISERVSGFTQLVARYQFNNLRTGGLTEKIVSLGMEAGVRFFL